MRDALLAALQAQPNAMHHASGGHLTLPTSCGLSLLLPRALLPRVLLPLLLPPAPPPRWLGPLLGVLLPLPPAALLLLPPLLRLMS